MSQQRISHGTSELPTFCLESECSFTVVASRIARATTGASTRQEGSRLPTRSALNTKTATTLGLEADLLTHGEVDLLMQACSTRAPSGRRNRALIAVLWRCGLRLGEALTLSIKDIDLDALTVTVQRGNARERVVGLDLGTALLIDQWLVRRRKLGIGPKALLFCTLEGNAIQQSYVRHLLKRLAAKADIDKRVHANGLRRRFAVDLIHDRQNLLTVRDRLGHSSAATTQAYLSRIGVTDGSIKPLDFPAVGSEASRRSGSSSRQT